MNLLGPDEIRALMAYTTTLPLPTTREDAERGQLTALIRKARMKHAKALEALHPGLSINIDTVTSEVLVNQHGRETLRLRWAPETKARYKGGPLLEKGIYPVAGDLFASRILATVEDLIPTPTRDGQRLEIASRDIVVRVIGWDMDQDWFVFAEVEDTPDPEPESSTDEVHQVLARAIRMYGNGLRSTDPDYPRWGDLSDTEKLPWLFKALKTPAEDLK